MPKENEPLTNKKSWKYLKEENFVEICKDRTYKRYIKQNLTYSYQSGIVGDLFVKYCY